MVIVYEEQARYEEAEPLLLEVLETRTQTIESLNNLIARYEAWNKPEKAKEWQAKQAQIEDFGE